MSHKFIFRISYLSMAQTLCLILSVLFVSGQSDDWEKHILAVNNSQLTGNGKYLWQTVLQSKYADSIVKAADKMPVATNRRLIMKQLIPLLTDNCQGIAIHYVLCAIWKRQSSGDRGGFGSGNVTYHGLNFYEKEGQYMADPEELAANQKRWIEFMNQ
ncbi:MAG: hypothetical protein EOO04_22000 [Chitinophagaceae bacterium]|nr:MAG: hypothetical protein EOO04_22000 [Chitinophagaceae bacterium]